jgi:hypothetical protein
VSEDALSMEARILQAVKRTLAAVIRDTATPHGMRHPLSDSTIEDLRQCLALISARERELAGDASQSRAAAARSSPMRCACSATAWSPSSPTAA